MLNEKVYDAFLSMGASEQKARDAAVALAEGEPRLTRLEGRIDLLTWMVATNIAMTIGVLFKLLH